MSVGELAGVVERKGRRVFLQSEMIVRVEIERDDFLDRDGGFL
jgi:hypothetical protein